MRLYIKVVGKTSFSNLNYTTTSQHASFPLPPLALATHAFRVFDNTAYTNTSIGYGSTPINWIPNYVCRPLVQNDGLPSAEQWQAIVRSWLVYPGYPLVLDCEDLYLTKQATADSNLARLQALQTWAAGVLPEDSIIGWYGILGNTPTTFYDHYRALIANHTPHAFFPSAYTFTSSFSTWETALEEKIQEAKEIHASLPVVPYTWPQYHNNYSFVPVDLWERQLTHLQTLGGCAGNKSLAGFVVWGGKNHAVCDDACQAVAGQQPWLAATRNFLSQLYGLYGGKRVSGGQVFTGF